jgi:hypothetical protein
MAPPRRLERIIMLSRLRRIFIAIVVIFSMSLPFAAAQKDVGIERGVKLDPAASDSSGSSPAALPYFAMAIYTMLIMTIVCMPSRKA